MINGGFGKLKIADGAVLVDNDVDDEVLTHTVEEVLESEAMAQCWGHNDALEFIPESTLSQYPPEQPVVDLSEDIIVGKSLDPNESPTRYIIYDRVLKQQVTFLKKAIGVEAPPQSPPHLMPIPNPHADKTNNPKDLINTQLSQSQRQLEDMMSIVSNMQKHMEQKVFEAKCRDQERELLEQKRENRAQERDKQAEEREKRAEIKAHAMTNNLQNLINKQSEEHDKMIMIVKNMQKQMGDQASKAEHREQARDNWEEDKDLIIKQFQEQCEKMTMIINDNLKQMKCQALKAECRQEERDIQEQERAKQAQIKAQAM